jgi:hypothetical protein
MHPSAQLVPKQTSEHVVGAPHWPLVVHVSSCVLLVHWVWPGAHTPVHAPPTHVWLLQAAAVPHVPVDVHVSTPLLLESHCVVPHAQTPVPVPTGGVPTTQFAVQEFALWPAAQFAVQEFALFPAVQYVVQELASSPQLQFCMQLLQLPVHTQSPVQLLQFPATTVTAALLVPAASVVEGTELHAITRHEKRTGTNHIRAVLLRPQPAGSALTKPSYVTPGAIVRLIVAPRVNDLFQPRRRRFVTPGARASSP